jgi:hypothetical protein
MKQEAACLPSSFILHPSSLRRRFAMVKHSWIRQLFTRPVTHTVRQAPHRGRPTLEVLEDRCVPSTFIVNNTSDSFVHSKPAQGTLRWAVDQANSTSGANTIAFAKSVFATPQTITLSKGELSLTNTTGMETILGPAAGVTVNAGGQGPVFGVSGLVASSISGLTISRSNAYAGVSNFGTLTLTNCTISHNFTAGYSAIGGGLINRGTATLINCTVSDNTAEGVYGAAGAGVYNFDIGTLTLTNCTISGNYAASDQGGASGGGLSNGGTAILTNCTISGNIGGGLANGGTATLANTIIAANDGLDVSGAVTSKGNNLIGETDGSSGWVSSDLTGTNAQPLNALLAPLGDYGGRTQTMSLLPGSPAIDAGINTLIPPGVTTDQRGRPRIINRHVDIGAFESSGFTISVTSGSGQSTGVNTAFPAPLVVTVTANNPIEPLSFGLITFIPPARGASATLTGSPATLSGSGMASITASANGSAGSYTVSARATGIKTPATFSLTNTMSNTALEPSASDALRQAGNAGIKMAGNVYVDSSSSVSLSGIGDASARGGKILVGGNELDYGTTARGHGKINLLTDEPAWAAVDRFFADAALEQTTIHDF